MKSFYGQSVKQERGFYGSWDNSPAQPMTPVGQNPDVAPFYAAALDRDYNEVLSELETGFGAVLYGEANNTLNEVNSTTSTAAITAGLEDQTLTMDDINRLSEGLMFERFVAPDVGLLLADNPELSKISKRALERVIAAERMVRARMPQDDMSFWQAAGLIGDQAVSSVVQNVLGFIDPTDTFEGAGDLTELAREAAMLLTMDVPKEEFEQRFGEILDRVSDSGLFTQDNPFALADFIAIVGEGGEGMHTKLNEIFQMIDVGTAGAASLPKTLTALGGTARSVRVLNQAIRSNPNLAAAATQTGLTRAPGEFFSHPSLQVLRDLEAENQALTFIKDSSLGQILSPEVLAQKQGEILAQVRDLNTRWSTNTIDYSLEEGFSRLFGVATLGKRNAGGAVPYSTRQGAENLAKQVGGEVREVVENGTTKYVVAKQYDIKLNDLTDATDLSDVAGGILHSIMSTTARTTPGLDALLKQGEAQVARVLRNLGDDYKRIRKQVSREEIHNVDAIFKELQSDPNFSMRTQPYTDTEFAQRYAAKFGDPPSQEVIDYHRAVNNINDVDYYLNANRILREAIENDETMADLGGVWYRSRRVRELPEDANVYDVDTGMVVKYSDLNARARASVLDVMDGYEISQGRYTRYVAGRKLTTRRLYHTDVLPYNAGGHRRYTGVLNNYIKQEMDDLVTVGGTLASKPRTFMAVRTEAEAQEVVDSWGRIIEALNNGAPNIDEVIRANNRWNTSIEDIADLQRFADDHGLDLTRPLRWAPDGEPLMGDAAGRVAQRFAGESTLGSYFRKNALVSRQRGTQPLMGFGGENLDILDPTKAIERGFASTVYRQGDMNYLHNAINGWYKAALKEDAILNPQDLVGVSPRQALLKAEIRKTDAGKKLLSERQTIIRRMSYLSPQIQEQRNFLRGVADWAYGKDKKKLAKLFDKASLKDPVGFMRALAFHSKLGMFAIDQVMVQASQAINVAAITSSTIGTTGAVRGVLAAGPLRMALVRDMPEAAARRIAKIQATYSGISADDFLKLRDWVEATGRNVVDKTIVEENNVAGFAAGKSFLDAGQWFFNEGEQLARLSAATTNFLERRARYGVEDIFDPTITKQMIHRQDVLTASMTSASAAPWQRSVLAIPLQFTTYQVRMMEQLFTDRILTPNERIRLGLAHMFAYGAAGVPFAGMVQDRMGYTGTVDPNNELYSVVRYGAMDAILGYMLDTDTALSTRLAVGEGVWDFIKNMGEQGMLETLSGPSGSIGFDATRAFYSFAKNVVTGDFKHLEYDWNRLARNVTAYNRAYNFYTAMNYGAYYSRMTEQGLAENLTTPESFAMLLGIPLEEQDALWSSVANTMLDDKFLDIKTKEMKRLYNIAISKIDEGDYESAEAFFNDMGAEIAILPYSQQQKIHQRLQQTINMGDLMQRTLFTRGRIEWANYLNGLTNE